MSELGREPSSQSVFAYLRSLGFKFLAPNVTLGPGPVDAVPQAVRLARCDGAHVPGPLGSGRSGSGRSIGIVHEMEQYGRGRNDYQ